MNNPLIQPDPGLFIWTIITFLVLLGLLAKFAWKPLLKGLKERDNSIAQALQAAEIAKREVSQLHTESEKLLSQAKSERDKILLEAREFKNSVMGDAREQAKKETVKMINEAREAIKNERASAIQDIKKQVSELSVAISEKILMKELSDPGKQEELIEKSLNEIKFN